VKGAGMAEGWIVACLCAEWCGACREYRPVFEAAAVGSAARFAWVDIEEHPDVLGEREVESFPTLLIAHGGDVAFFGPVTPHAAAITALVDRALAGRLGTLADGSIAALAARVAAHVHVGR